MKFMLSLLAFGYVAIANPVPSLPVHPGGIGGLFKGPNSETIIRGPDGSVITTAAEGGEIHTKLDPIVVAEPIAVEEISPIISVTPAPAIETKLAELGPTVIETALLSTSLVENEQSSDLIGPSGRIATQGSQAVIAGPASTTISGPAVVAETIIKGPPIVGGPVLIDVSAISAVTPTPISVTVSPPTLIGTGGPTIATVTATPPVAIITPSPQAVATASISPQYSVASAASANGASATASASANQASASVGAVDGVNLVTASPLPVLPSVLSPVVTERIPFLGNPGLLGINHGIDLGPQLIPDQVAIDNRQIILNPANIPPGNIIPPEIVVTPKSIPGRLRPTPGTLLTTPGLGAIASSTNIQREEADAIINVTPNPTQLQSQEILTQRQLIELQNRQRQLDATLTVTPSNLQSVLTQEQLLALQNQQAEAGRSLAVTPNTLQTRPQDELSQQQVWNIQNQQAQAERTLGVTTNIAQRRLQNELNQQQLWALQNQQTLADRIVNEKQPQSGLTQQQLVALQNQQSLLNNQIQQNQEAGSSGILTSTRQPAEPESGSGVIASNVDTRLVAANNEVSLANVQQQQQILNAELFRSGSDPSQLRLTSVPLASLSSLPSGLESAVTLNKVGINNGLPPEVWERYGRDVQNKTKKKNEDKKN